MTTKKTSTKRPTKGKAGDERDERPKELDMPEPRDKTSDEWRYWKLRHVEDAFGCYGPTNPATYEDAWAYCRDLLLGLINDRNFWHTCTCSRSCRTSSSRGRR